MRLKPLPRGSGYRFTDAIVGGVIPGKYIPSVDKGIQEASKRGILAGYPVVDFEAECYFGSYHSVDSSDIAFQMAGILAFHKAAENAQAGHPRADHGGGCVHAREFMGDVIGDLNHRRGQILGMEPGRCQDARYARWCLSGARHVRTTLRSLTQGRAFHSRKLHGYEEVPTHIAQKIIEQAKKEKEEVHA